MRCELRELQALVSTLEKDLQERCEKEAGLKAELQAAWKQAKSKERTADTFTEWYNDYATQVAVAWVLTSVFVRFLEDNALIQETRLAGISKDAMHHAEENHQLYFRAHPTHSDTDYLSDVFERFGKLPAGEVFTEHRNPLYNVRISGDAGMALLRFFRETNPDTGELKREFKVESGNTRFLGDYYQDLSKAAREKYALLQTPDFVEDYILDYTLEPAIETFGLNTVRFIDPTCGSGHFLLGGFTRLLEKKLRAGVERSQAVRQALDAAHGVDLNPFAVAIARFRLTVAALFALNPDAPPTLERAPEFPIHIAVGDSLLHGKHFVRFATSTSQTAGQVELDRFKWDSEKYGTEDNDLVDYILGQQYHAVVGNPPYITPKDKAANTEYRKLYHSCHRQYALVCPFFERFFELAVGQTLDDAQGSLLKPKTSEVQPGFVGMIIANSFMKREFGSKLIEEVIPHLDITHVVDTSGAYIPGHGTPTAIILGRNQDPQTQTVRGVLGIRGEPKTPEDARQGKVWRAIADHTDESGFQNDFISVDDLDRSIMHTHPWSLRGGGALDLKATLEAKCDVLEPLVENVGFMCITKQDDVFSLPKHVVRRAWAVFESVRDFGVGEEVRDWRVARGSQVIFPYSPQIQTLPEEEIPQTLRWFWSHKQPLGHRKVFGGQNYFEAGKPWYEFGQIPADRFKPLSITFASVATHNHFVLDRGGKVFKQSAPVIKLPEGVSEEEHLGLLGLLNSSTACFWMKQVFYPKGGDKTGDGGRRSVEGWHDRYDHDCTKIKKFPICSARPYELATRLDALASEDSRLQPVAIAELGLPTAGNLDSAHSASEQVFAQMVALQEELDWKAYVLYGLLTEDEAPLAPDLDALPEVKPGERAFEIVMAREIEAGDLVTSWFERHDSPPITTIPSHWPQWYQDLVEQRIALMKGPRARRFIKLIEQPEYKRRWKRTPWDELEKEALKNWLLDRLETPAYIPQADREGHGAHMPPSLISLNDLADMASRDADFMSVAARYTGDTAFVVEKLVKDLVLAESVPYLPSQRLKTEGIRKLKEWEQVWELQRREDAGQDVGQIPVPPSYVSSDFQNGPSWSLRGKLDVPKERFTVYPGLEYEGQTFVSWAGLDHRQRAQALAAFYFNAKTSYDWPQERFAAMLAGLKDLLPWLKKWHNAPDEDGNRLGDFIEGMVAQESRDFELDSSAIEKTRLGT